MSPPQVGPAHILFFFVRLSSLRYWSGELNHSPYFRRHCSLYSISRLISITSASSTCQCASRLLSTLTRSDLASARARTACTRSPVTGEREGRWSQGKTASGVLAPSMSVSFKPLGGQTANRFACRSVISNLSIYRFLQSSRVPRFFRGVSHRQYTVPLCLGVREPGVAELRSIRVVCV